MSKQEPAHGPTVTKTDTKDCGCLLNELSNGSKSIDPCLGHSFKIAAKHLADSAEAPTHEAAKPKLKLASDFLAAAGQIVVKREEEIRREMIGDGGSGLVDPTGEAL